MKMLIAGGGTGGHLYPGIAVARLFLKRFPSADVLFVGTKNGIEQKVLPLEGLPLKTIMIGGIKGKRVHEMTISILKIPVSILQSIYIILKYKPDIVLGVGGYASFPVALASKVLSVPVIIHEQNSIPGLSNRLLSPISDRIAVSFFESLSFFPKNKTIVTGNPVREELLSYRDTKTDDSRFTIFIFGGSQGASSINRAVIESLDMLMDKRERIAFIHQTGSRDLDMVKERYERGGWCADVLPYIDNMGVCYGRADLVICRSGATTLAELTAFGKPAILIPYPYAVSNHQEVNARTLVKNRAAEMIIEKEMTGERLASEIRIFLEDNKKQKEMALQSRKMADPESAEKIIGLIEGMI